MMMIVVFICEDQEQQRRRLQKVVNDYITMESLDMEVGLSIADPRELLKYIRGNDISQGLYFLDIDLRTDINGIELAAEIRKYDKRGMIVFVTADKESLKLTFKYYVEAIGYIVKDDIESMEKEVKRCIDLACERLIENKEKMFLFQVGDRVLSRPYSEILYFEKSKKDRNKVRLVTKKGEFEFYQTLKGIESMHGSFCRVGGSYVFNLDNVKSVVRSECKVIMVNDLVCVIPSRRVAAFGKTLKNFWI